MHVRVDDRLRPLEDRRRDRSRLLAAAADDAQQRREGLPVHAGIPLRVGAGRRVKLSDAATLKWQAGLFLFTQNYDQDAVNNFAPVVLSPFIPVRRCTSTRRRPSLDDTGVGVYGRGRSACRRVDLTARRAVRSREPQGGRCRRSSSPADCAAGPGVNTEKSFSNVSPQVAVAYRVQPDAMVYFSVTGGFKAGGFNPASPAGQRGLRRRAHAGTSRAGVKSALAGRRVTANLAVFSIDWQDLQLNLPNPQVPGQFYIANVGSARSSGVEFELQRPRHATASTCSPRSATRTRASAPGRRRAASTSPDNEIPNTPDYTATLRRRAVARRSRRASGSTAAPRSCSTARSSTTRRTSQGQDAYSLANFRVGVRGKRLFVEAWIRNAFDTKYIPVAFAYRAARAVRVRRRTWPAAHVRRHGRCQVLSLEARSGVTGDQETICT